MANILTPADWWASLPDVKKQEIFNTIVEPVPTYPLTVDWHRLSYNDRSLIHFFHYEEYVKIQRLTE